MSRLTYPAHLRRATLDLAAGADPRELGIGREWTVTDHEAWLGQGRGCFDAATRRLLSWRAHRHASVAVEREGSVLRLKLGPTRSPCQILVEESTPTRTVLVYGTLPGHALSGEEAFLITMAPDGTVRGRCVAFSRLSWWLARIGAPVARRVQRAATQSYVSGMRP